MTELELEKLKIQKTQMYLQVASVFMSAILLYVLISNKQSPPSLVEPEDLGEFE